MVATCRVRKRTRPHDHRIRRRLNLGSPAEADTTPRAGHVVIFENSRGWSFRRLFAPYLNGATHITIRDPYVRLFHQVRNTMEFLQLVYDLVPEGDEVVVNLVTQSDAETCVRQEEMLAQVAQAFAGTRVAFTWELDASPGFSCT